MKTLFITLGVVFLLCAIAGAFLVYRFVKHIAESASAAEAFVAKHPPPQIQVGVVVRQSAFQKTLAFERRGLGLVTDLKLGRFNPPDGNMRLAIVGVRGAEFLEFDRTASREVMFDRSGYSPVSLLEDKMGRDVGYLSHGSWGEPMVVFGPDGKTRWSYGGYFSSGVDDSASGDLYGDGGREFVVGFNGGAGIVLLDSNGKEVWRKPEGNVWHTEIAQVNADGRAEILHSDARGLLVARDATGNVNQTHRLETYVSQFALTSWKDDSTPDKVLMEGKDQFLISSLDGSLAARLPATLLFRTVSPPAGTTVNFGSSGRYFAVLMDYYFSHRSVLYLYDEKDNLGYQEVLDSGCDSLLAQAGKSGETLLVGCEGIVWEYAPSERPRARAGTRPRRKSQSR